MTTCTASCVDDGIETLVELVAVIISGAVPTAAPTIIQLLTNALVTFQCKLPKNVITTINDQLLLLRNLTTTTLEQENIAYLTILAGTFLILIIFIFTTILLESRNATILFFILSIIVIFIAFGGLFLWLRSIYTSTDTQMKKILSTIGGVLNKTIEAGQNAFCCLQGCQPCATCPI